MALRKPIALMDRENGPKLSENLPGEEMLLAQQSLLQALLKPNKPE